jgi:hypothetical protein
MVASGPLLPTVVASQHPDGRITVQEVREGKVARQHVALIRSRPFKSVLGTLKHSSLSTALAAAAAAAAAVLVVCWAVS